MPGTVDDFMQRFGGGGTVTDQEAAQHHDRFVSSHADDRDFDSDTYHRKLPDDQFHQAATTAISQAPPQEREGLLGGLLGALGGKTGGGIGGLAGMLGLGSSDPRQMSPADGARVVDYARREHPELIQQTVQEKPWFMKALGNPIVTGALAVAAAKMMSGRKG